jgi:hypothetical protein
MGTSAETAIVLFADQGKETSFFFLSFQQKNGSLLFQFSVCSKQTEVVLFISQMSSYSSENLHTGRFDRYRYLFKYQSVNFSQSLKR